MIWVIVAAGIVVLAIAWLLLTFNRMVRARNTVQRAFSQIDVQLRRRHDLIPPLVETVKGYMAHEKATLDAVITARSAAVGAQDTANAPVGAAMAGAMAQMGGAENTLTQTLGQLFLRAEDYPELKASENMLRLGEELTSTENRVAYSRQAYNDAVLSYNTKLQSFPTNLVANNLGFKPAELWEIEFAAVRSTPGLTF